GEAEGPGLHVVPPGAEAAVHPPVGEVVDGGERLGEEAGVPVGHAVDPAAEADLGGVHRRRGQRRDGLVAVHVAAPRRGLLEVVGHREPVEATGVGEFPQLAHLGERAAHVADVDPEFHSMFSLGARGVQPRRRAPESPHSTRAPAHGVRAALHSGYDAWSAARTPGRAPIMSTRQRRTRAMFASAFSGMPPRDTWAMNSSRLVVIRSDALTSSCSAWTPRWAGRPKVATMLPPV